MTRNVLDLIRGVPKDDPKTKKRVRRRASIPHGTVNSYQNYGCRCKRCRAANTKSHRKYMRSKGYAAQTHNMRELHRRYTDKGLPLPELEDCPRCGRTFVKGMGLLRHYYYFPECKPEGWEYPITHGTQGGYTRCRKRPEGACDQCKGSENKRKRDRRRELAT